jgi:hypothetical protein
MLCPVRVVQDTAGGGEFRCTECHQSWTFRHREIRYPHAAYPAGDEDGDDEYEPPIPRFDEGQS